MKKVYFQLPAALLIFFSGQDFLLAQCANGAMVINGSAYMRISNGQVYLVVDNSGSCAIKVNGSSGGIISESQFNYVKWMTGNATGTAYKIPWRDETVPTTEDISVTFDITSAGNAGGFFLASTYDGAWQNSTYMPAPVTNMSSNPPDPDASEYTLDRFWALIDEASYTTKPALSNLIFSYPDNEHDFTSGNTITESNLQAQRWNTPLASNNWEGLMFGADNAAANTVTIGALTAANLFRWWVLEDNTMPLPVTFLNFSAWCDNGNVEIQWSTAPEQNSGYFIIERSADGSSFSSIGTKPAAINSSTVKNYSFTDTDPLFGTAFYRVTEVDQNGDRQSTNIIAVSSCSSDNIFIYSSEGSIYVNITASENGKYQLELYNMLGQSLAKELRGVSKGKNTIKLMPELAGGVYFVNVKNMNNPELVSGTITKKVFVRSNY